MENKIIELANALIDEIEKQGLDLYDEKTTKSWACEYMDSRKWNS